MKSFVRSALVIVGLALCAIGAAEAAPKSKGDGGQPYTVKRGGGYSYSYADSVNTYGDSRTRYGGASVYRDPTLDRQTPSGPFDHGFFFDSAVQPRGGEAPYMH